MLLSHPGRVCPENYVKIVGEQEDVKASHQIDLLKVSTIEKCAEACNLLSSRCTDKKSMKCCKSFMHSASAAEEKNCKLIKFAEPKIEKAVKWNEWIFCKRGDGQINICVQTHSRYFTYRVGGDK